MPRVFENVEAFTAALGPQNAAVILPLAIDVNWPDSASRDEFIAGLVGGAARG